MNTPCKHHTVVANARGYGVVRFQGKSRLLHRIVYCQEHGLALEDIKGLVIRHKCDNPKCIEPTHLLLGTNRQNIQDMYDRGRNSPPPHHSGENHACAKLTYEQVRIIRAQYRAGTKQTDIAQTFGVTPTAILHIVHNKTWNEFVCEVNAAISPLHITPGGLKLLGFKLEARAPEPNEIAIICGELTMRVGAAAKRGIARAAA